MKKDARHEGRDLCADLIRINWKNEAGEEFEDWATLEDISSSGACLQAEQPIPPGTTISLDPPGAGCTARVKYCTFQQIGFFLGVEFLEGYRWSRLKYKPSHLLQFRLRAAKKAK